MLSLELIKDYLVSVSNLHINACDHIGLANSGKRNTLTFLDDERFIEEAKKISQGSRYIFEGTKPNKPLSENTFNKLMKDLGLDVHAHGFRTSFRTWTQEKTNYPREIAEAALAHSLKDKAEAAYARSDLLEKRAEMMEAWAQFVSADASDMIHFRA